MLLTLNESNICIEEQTSTYEMSEGKKKRTWEKPSLSLTSAGRLCSTVRSSICSGGRN